MNALEFSMRCRRIADKIDQYVNRFGEKTGWDAGLHAFMKSLEPTEALIDEKIERALTHAKASQAHITLATSIKELLDNGISLEDIRSMTGEILGEVEDSVDSV